MRNKTNKWKNLPGDLLAFSVDFGPHDAGLIRGRNNLLNPRQVTTKCAVNRGRSKTAVGKQLLSKFTVHGARESIAEG
jgi:hypothetical protein